MVKNPPAMQETWFHPWVGKIPWRRERLTTPIWTGEFHGLYSPWGCKESDTTERLSLSLHYNNDIVGLNIAGFISAVQESESATHIHVSLLGDFLPT